MDKVYLENPMDRGFFDELFGLDKKVYKEGIENMLKYYDKLLKEVNGTKYLPKGTILYHGSLDYPFYADSKEVKNIIYLGLDMDISMWYIYESIMKQQYNLKSLKDKLTGSKSFKRYGFLYAFKLTKDLPINHIIDKLYLNPKELKRCKKNTCLHPQVSYRGPDFNYVIGSKIHSELTLNYYSYRDSLEIIRIYIVDGLSLHSNHGDMDYNIRKSIIKEYEEGVEDYLSLISYKEYSEIFMDEIYYCDNCEFSGSYQDVVEHEKTCSKKSGKKLKKKPKRKQTKKKQTKKKPKKKPKKKQTKKK